MNPIEIQMRWFDDPDDRGSRDGPCWVARVGTGAQSYIDHVGRGNTPEEAIGRLVQADTATFRVVFVPEPPPPLPE